MLNRLAKQLIHARLMLDPARAVRYSIAVNLLQLGRLVFVVSRAIARWWSFCKDIHFSWYVIIPVISSISPLDGASALVIWGLFFLPILVVITFNVLGSVFDLSGTNAGPQERTPNGWNNQAPPRYAGLTGSRGTSRPRATGYAAMYTSMPAAGPRRPSLRQPRSRRPGLW